MKSYFITLILVACFQMSAQESVNFVNDHAEAVSLAKDQNKAIMAMVYADWCPHCETMKKTVLADSEVINFLNSNYVNLLVNSDTGAGKMFMKRYGITSFPQFVFLNSDRELLYNLNGKRTVPVFLQECRNALQPELQLTHLSKEFLEDTSNAEKCLNYINTLKKAKDRNKIAEVARTYLQTKDLESLFNENDWSIIAAGVNDFESREFQFLLKNQAEFAKVASQRRVENKILNVIILMQKEPMEKLNIAKYESNRSLAKGIGLNRADSLVYRQDLRFYPNVNNWEGYVASTRESVDKILLKDTKALNEIATNYVAYVDDKKELQNALKWAKISDQLNETHETNFIIAKLYQKLGDIDNAMTYAHKSKAIIDKMGWDNKSVDEFISKFSTPRTR